MDIDVVAAWGEFLGGIAGIVAALGVIITLLYLSRQVHQNTDQIRAAYLHHIAGRLEDEYWDTLSGQLKMVLGVPGIRQDWEQTADNYHAGFRDHLKTLYDRSAW